MSVVSDKHAGLSSFTADDCDGLMASAVHAVLEHITETSPESDSLKEKKKIDVYHIH